MCLILLAYKVHPSNDLVVLANRDEFHLRPTKNAHWWNDAPNVLAGKDLKAGGTWLGLNKLGKFCALTNYRDPKNFRSDAVSRGSLVIDYLKEEENVNEYTKKHLANVSIYNDFNLVFYEDNSLYFFSSRAKDLKQLKPGIYGLSNASLDSNWPKINLGKGFLSDMISHSNLNANLGFEILGNQTKAKDETLPSTGVDLEKERLLSPMHIDYPGYGTRSSNVIFFGKDKSIEFYERDHLLGSENSFSFNY